MPLISRVNRTHRVHMMQRSVNSVIVLDECRGLFGGVFFSSTIRALGPAVLVAVVLQLALAGLVAHRAVERVVEEQPFERVGLRLLRALAGLARPSCSSGRRAGRASDGSRLSYSPVTMTVPSFTGVWQPGKTFGCIVTLPSFRSPTSTRHMRQTGDDGQRRVPAVVRDEHARRARPPGCS